MTKKVSVGMSGGVDSAVAALLLKKEGYDVSGYTLVFGPWGRELADVKSVAAHLDIPLRVIPAEDVFRKEIIIRFIGEYRSGRTPSPCPLCNPLKFGLGLEAAGGEGYVASGHYARMREGALYASPHDKDQSYFLARLSESLLRRLLLPLGEMTKEEVRAEAARAGLSVAEKGDSQDVCFIPDGDYRAFLEKEGLPPCPGEAVDEEGKAIGAHEGYFHYTRGQRFRLGGTSDRLYVTGSRPEDNTLIIGPDRSLWGRELKGTGFHPLASAEDLAGPLLAKVRSRDSLHPCRLERSQEEFRLLFEEEVRAVTPGQLAVLYKASEEGMRVAGSGWIL
ncbi:MAG TPA: tRNA 2-thiouridine(34) synthase MnmA [Candidatus Mcinerneyibacteriales bacterium]|mgnify:FL=1|nr:tRNA 2-thiouridine(34) synthase MnmA [Candidatus Mcinerneyibacteriales bacterium]